MARPPQNVEDTAGEVPPGTAELGAAATDAPLGNTVSAMLRALGDAPAMPLPVGLEPGTLLKGSFRIVSKIGAGGMGVVYRARDVRLDRDVAIKLHKWLDPEAGFDRLVREATAMAQLSHPNVVTVHEIGTFEGHLFIAMEYVDGATARAWLDAETRAPDEIVELFLAAGRGLAAAHAVGLVHRDFKPDNVLIGNDGVVRVADFGLARAPGDVADGDAGGAPGSGAASRVTRTGAMAGTPAYMAPEQLDGDSVDARADQFAFCVALYEALFGARPYRGDTVEDLADRFESGDDAAIPGGGRIPRRVRRALARGLARDRDARYPDMDALLADLGPDPAAGRRRVAATAGLAAIVGAIATVGAVYALRDDPAAACPAEGDTARALWNGARQSETEAAFAATELPYAQRTYDAVDAELTDYTRALADAREASCIARIDGAMPPSLLERRAACLARSERRLAGAVQILADADAGIVAKALRVATSLPAPARCRDEAFLLADVAPPPERVAGDVEAARARLGAGEALFHAGKYADARDAAEDVLARAIETDYDAVVAEAQALRGKALRSLSELEAAEEALRAAYLAARRAGDALLASETAGLLVWAVGEGDTRTDEAALWARLADVEIPEHERGTAVEAGALGAAALLDELRGDYAAAFEKRSEALRIVRGLGKRDLRLAKSINSVGVVLDYQGQYREATEHYREALALIEELLGPEHPDLLATLGNLGLSLSAQGEREEALVHLERGAALSRRLLGDDNLDTAYADLNVGVAYNGLQRYDDAIASYERALAVIVDKLGAEHPDASLCYNSLAVAYEGKGDFDRALDYHGRALAAAETLGPAHPHVALILGNIGAVLIDKGAPADAVEPLERAVSIWEETDPENTKKAHALTNLGIARVEAQRPGAVEPLEQALALLEAAGVETDDVPRTQFALARALPAAERARAEELARAALSRFEALGGTFATEQVPAIRAWLTRR